MDEKSLKRFEELNIGGDQKPTDHSEIDRLWKLLDQDVIDVDVEDAWSKVSQEIEQHSSLSLTPVLKWVASLIMVLGMSWITYSFLADSDVIQFQAQNGDQEFKLPDNSTVILSRGSTLSFSNDSQNREVSLLGSAFFDVQKNSDYPFLISSGELKVEVVGTSFEVISEDNAYKLAVREGQVNVQYGEEYWSLSKGNALTIYTELNTYRKFSGIENISNQWLKRPVTYSNQRVDKVLQLLSYKHDLEVDYSPGKLRNCLISGRFDLSNLQDSLDQLSLAVGFSFKIVDRKLKISGEGC